MAWTHQGNGVFILLLLYHNVYCASKVSGCDICQRVNQKMTSTSPEPVSVKSPIYHIGIDFVGPITPISEEGIIK